MTNDLLKQHYLDFVKKIQAEGHNLVEEPILFVWSWPEAPDIVFRLMIGGEVENTEGTTEQVTMTEQDEEEESYGVQMELPITVH